MRGPFESVPSPPDQPEANAGGSVPALIEGVVPLPPVLLLRSKSAVGALYAVEGLSAREITRLVGASRSGVLKALDRFSIPRNQDRPTRIGPLPFGFDYLNHRLVKNGAEQTVIRMMRRDRAGGLSLREIAGNLNLKLIPTKQNGYLPVCKTGVFGSVLAEVLFENRLRPAVCRRAPTSTMMPVKQ